MRPHHTHLNVKVMVTIVAAGASALVLMSAYATSSGAMTPLGASLFDTFTVIGASAYLLGEYRGCRTAEAFEHDLTLMGPDACLFGRRHR